ncbi:unnamed protein product, partial [marine sediment metagenome]
GKIAYTEKTIQHQYIFMSIWTIKSDTLYLLAYVARADEYPKGLDKFDEMVNSFEIFNKTVDWEVYRNDKYGFELHGSDDLSRGSVILTDERLVE